LNKQVARARLPAPGMAAAGADPPPKDGLGAGYPTVRFTA